MGISEICITKKEIKAHILSRENRIEDEVFLQNGSEHSNAD